MEKIDYFNSVDSCFCFCLYYLY